MGHSAMPTPCKKIYKREGDQSNTPRAKQGYYLASVYLTSTKTQINVCFFVINFALFFNLKKPFWLHCACGHSERFYKTSGRHCITYQKTTKEK